MLSATLQVLLLAAIVSICQGDRYLLFDNRFNETIWIGSKGYKETRPIAYNNKYYVDKPPVLGGGWKMEAHKMRVVHVDDNWSGRFWARTKCDESGKNCQTGSCEGGARCKGDPGEPPATLVEFTFTGVHATDLYQVSLVDGFNVKVAIEPTERRCAAARCAADMNADCPEELRKEQDGRVVGCLSACAVYHSDEYCCEGSYNSADTCTPSDWDTNYVELFKDHCPDAYSYKFDDKNKTKTCHKTAYKIIFG